MLPNVLSPRCLHSPTDLVSRFDVPLWITVLENPIAAPLDFGNVAAWASANAEGYRPSTHLESAPPTPINTSTTQRVAWKVSACPAVSSRLFSAIATTIDRIVCYTEANYSTMDILLILAILVAFNVDGKSQSIDIELLLRPARGAEYCDRFVCLCVCLTVREHIAGTAGPVFTKFCAQIRCAPWLDPPLATWRYVMYFRFYGWRHVGP